MTREQQYIDFFSQLSLEKLDSLAEIFEKSARFKDPFNDVRGIEAIKNIFTHMYATTTNPSFEVNHSAKSNDILFLEWDFTFTKNRKDWLIKGTSLVTFNNQDKVIEHVDYWDPAEQIYSKIPLLGGVMRFLTKRLSAT